MIVSWGALFFGACTFIASPLTWVFGSRHAAQAQRRKVLAFGGREQPHPEARAKTAAIGFAVFGLVWVAAAFGLVPMGS